jgi:hypothetical protein
LQNNRNGEMMIGEASIEIFETGPQGVAKYITASTKGVIYVFANHIPNYFLIRGNHFFRRLNGEASPLGLNGETLRLLPVT